MLVIMILYLYSILVKCDRYINIQRIRFPTIDHVYIYDLACNRIIRTVGGWDNWWGSKWLNKKIFWSGPGVFWWLEAGMEQPGECNPFFVLKCSTRQKNTVHYLHYFCRTNIYMIWNQTISFVGQDMNLLCHQCSSHLFFSYELDLIWLEFL